MTAVTSISAMKGKKQGQRSRNSDGKPKPGTNLRAVYDALRTGSVVNVTRMSGRSKVAIGQLRDFYGMDIERVSQTDGKRGVYAGVRLLGEWEGPYYVPIERIVAGMAGEA